MLKKNMTITHFAEAFIVLIFFQQSCSNSMEKIKKPSLFRNPSK